MTHMALVGLEKEGILKYAVTQTVDGLHVRSTFPREKLYLLHVFIEKCQCCQREFVRREPVATVGMKHTGNSCSGGGSRGKCRGKMSDTLLDWEDALPLEDLSQAQSHSKEADLSLCLGTSLQMMPAASLPLMALKRGGKMAIINLQKTKYDKKASLVIHAKVDEVMKAVMRRLQLPIPEWTFHVKREHGLDSNEGGSLRKKSCSIKLDIEQSTNDVYVQKFCASQTKLLSNRK